MAENTIFIPTGLAFSFSECLWFLNRNFDDCLHSIDGNQIRKALFVNEQPVLISISEREGSLQAIILKGGFSPEIKAEIVRYIIDWFDIERDIMPFYKLIQQHKLISYMSVDFHGLRLTGIPDLFEALCWAIIGQQINLRFAYKLKRRLVERFGESIEYDHSIYYIFPTCEILANVRVEDLREMQFSARKAEYLIIIARAFSKGEISKQKISSLSDFTSRQKALTAIKGIGVWTANYALMKTMREPSAIPHGDAGLLNALILHNVIKQKTDLAAIDRFFSRFPGWESYLVFYLWHALSRQ